MLDKVDNAASEIVVTELLKTKFLPRPILYCDLQACAINKAQIQSVDYQYSLLYTFRRIIALPFSLPSPSP